LVLSHHLARQWPLGYAGLFYPLALLFSALRHFMVAKDSIAPEAGFEKPTP